MNLNDKFTTDSETQNSILYPYASFSMACDPRLEIYIGRRVMWVNFHMSIFRPYFGPRHCYGWPSLYEFSVNWIGYIAGFGFNSGIVLTILAEPWVGHEKNAINSPKIRLRSNKMDY